MRVSGQYQDPTAREAQGLPREYFCLQGQEYAAVLHEKSAIAVEMNVLLEIDCIVYCYTCQFFSIVALKKSSMLSTACLSSLMVADLARSITAVVD